MTLHIQLIWFNKKKKKAEKKGTEKQKNKNSVATTTTTFKTLLKSDVYRCFLDYKK